MVIMTQSLQAAKTILAGLLILSLCVVLPGPVSASDKEQNDKDDDVRFTFYIAFGGAACAGLFWYLAYSSGFVSDNFLQKPALINYDGREGWSMGPPMPRLNAMTDRGDTYMEFLRIQFE